MDDEETSDVEEETNRSKDRGKKSKSRKQSSKELSTKKDGSKSKYAPATYVYVFAVLLGCTYTVHMAQARNNHTSFSC